MTSEGNGTKNAQNDDNYERHLHETRFFYN